MIRSTRVLSMLAVAVTVLLLTVQCAQAAPAARVRAALAAGLTVSVGGQTPQLYHMDRPGAIYLALDGAAGEPGGIVTLRVKDGIDGSAVWDVPGGSGRYDTPFTATLDQNQTAGANQISVRYDGAGTLTVTSADAWVYGSAPAPAPAPTEPESSGDGCFLIIFC